jgi:hypothetical protein
MIEQFDTEKSQLLEGRIFGCRPEMVRFFVHLGIWAPIYKASDD